MRFTIGADNFLDDNNVGVAMITETRIDGCISTAMNKQRLRTITKEWRKIRNNRCIRVPYTERVVLEIVEEEKNLNHGK